MTLIEALKSGRIFKRPHHDIWSKVIDQGSTLYVSASDILADDWEIEEPKVEITSRQLWDAYEKYSTSLSYTTVGCTDLVIFLAKELGLE